VTTSGASTVDLDGFAAQIFESAGRLDQGCWSARGAALALPDAERQATQSLLEAVAAAQARMTALAGAARDTSVAFTGTERSLESFAVDLLGIVVWLLGPSTATTLALAVTSATRAPVLNETAVSVHPTASKLTQEPRSMEELIGRIPRAGVGNAQVRIEHYGGDEPVYYVFVGGTIDTNIDPTSEAFDMSSNVNAIAGLDAASQRATIEAMREAGITASDHVILVGHSQGGLIAARIAQSEQFHVTDVVTVGAPIHAVPVPAGVRVVAIEHNEDIIPSLSGVAVAGATLGAASSLTVMRSVKGMPAEPGDTLPAHNLSRYVDTARSIDRSADPALRAAAARVTVREERSGTASWWRADRG